MARPGIEPWSPRPLANTLFIRPMVNDTKRTSSAKLKDASQEKSFQKWKENFKNLIVNPPEITDKPIQKIIASQLDIILGSLR